MLVVTLAAALGIPVSEDPLVAALAAMAGEGPPVLPAALPLAHEANELSLVPARTPMSICRKLRHDRPVDEHSDVVRTIPFGEPCAPSLPPSRATRCVEGLVCAEEEDVPVPPGAEGVCRRPRAGLDEFCDPSAPAATRIRCAPNLICQERTHGHLRRGTCQPKRAALNEACQLEPTGACAPFMTCEEYLACVARGTPHAVGGLNEEGGSGGSGGFLDDEGYGLGEPTLDPANANEGTCEIVHEGFIDETQWARADAPRGGSSALPEPDPPLALGMAPAKPDGSGAAESEAKRRSSHPAPVPLGTGFTASDATSRHPAFFASRCWEASC